MFVALADWPAGDPEGPRDPPGSIVGAGGALRDGSVENALRGAAAAGTAVGIYAHTFRGFTIDHVRVEVHEAISTDFAPTLRCLQSYTPTAELPTTCI